MTWLQEKITWIKKIRLEEIRIWFVHLFQRNIIIKFISLLCSVALWIYVMNETNPIIDQTISREITLVNVPSGYIVTPQSTSSRLKFRVQRTTFAAAQGEVRAVVNLEKAEEGTKPYRVEVSRPNSFNLLEYSPQEINITLDKIIEKEEGITFISTGVPEDDATATGIEPAIKKVKLTGPRSAINRVARVVGYVSIAGHNRDFSAQISLHANGNDNLPVTGVTVSPSEAAAVIRIVGRQNKKSVIIAPSITGQLAPEYIVSSIKLTPDKVEVAAASPLFETIKTVNTKPIDLSAISASQLAEGKASVTVELQPIEQTVFSTGRVTAELEIKPKQ